jgi:hypothetical protein
VGVDKRLACIAGLAALVVAEEDDCLASAGVDAGMISLGGVEAGCLAAGIAGGAVVGAGLIVAGFFRVA